MNFGKIVRLFKKGSVCVVGMRGTGKDMLIGNVIARRKRPYYSNVDYCAPKSQYYPLHYKELSVGGNTYRNFLEENIRPYKCTFEEETDIYISDIGILFPSQYCNELNRDYSSVPLHLALSRQLHSGSVHLNTQVYSRAWDKFREQSDNYIMCEWCKVIKGWVFQSVIIYDKAESCQARIRPCRISTPMLGNGKTDVRIYKDQFYNQHGRVDRHLLIYRNRSKYDTRIFREILKGETSCQKENVSH